MRGVGVMEHIMLIAHIFNNNMMNKLMPKALINNSKNKQL